MTWAMCQASPFFKEQWIKFIFEYLDLEPESIDSIEREVPDETNSGSRVDFLLRTNNGDKYLIEVKIGDQNHHFGQYETAYGVDSEHLGYITNYPHEERGYHVKQWKDFYDTLLLAKEDAPDDERSLITGYCEYLKNVCGLIMIQLINMERMSSLGDLTVLTRRVADSLAFGEFLGESFKVSNWNTSYRDDLRWLYFQVDYKQVNGWGVQYPFLGIIHRQPTQEHPKPYICAGFDVRQGWAKDIVAFMSDNKGVYSNIERRYCTEPKKDGDVYFELKPEALTDFETAQDVEHQEEILRGFLKEVFEYPLRVAQLVEEKASK